jgi:hypothetical protein
MSIPNSRVTLQTTQRKPRPSLDRVTTNQPKLWIQLKMASMVECLKICPPKLIKTQIQK